MIISLPIAIIVRNFCEQYEYFFKCVTKTRFLVFCLSINWLVDW